MCEQYNAMLKGLLKKMEDSGLLPNSWTYIIHTFIYWGAFKLFHVARKGDFSEDFSMKLKSVVANDKHLHGLKR
ncbi:hypothetical protein O6P43_013619 [Quillaja saponaria]|uniref:Uncharacterized protein n=1 Tax=Quillaja saponaria TaxID=32244 RepID=A0AAD7LT62_QUISA|nr:hypothetical protein O6P43_013619 [Quillaja saponaria]